MKGLLKALRHNWHMKLAALGLGMLLWLVVLLKTNPWTERSFTARIEARRVPQGLQVMSIDPSRFTVTLAGRARNIGRVAESGVVGLANLSGRDVGKFEVPVVIDTSALPHGVEVRSLESHAALVELDATVTQKRAVLTDFRGRAAPGFDATSGRPRPNEVEVTGPQTVVQGVASVYAVVDYSGITATKTFTSRLEARNARGMPQEGVTISPATAQVEIVVERINVNTVPVLLTWRKPPGRAIRSLTIAPPTVMVTGTPERLDAVAYIATEPIVADGDVTLAGVELRFPQGVSPVSDRTVQVNVTFEPQRLPVRPSPPATGPAPPAPEPGDEEPAPSADQPEEPPAPPPGPDADGGEGPATGRPGPEDLGAGRDRPPPPPP